MKIIRRTDGVRGGCEGISQVRLALMYDEMDIGVTPEQYAAGWRRYSDVLIAEAAAERPFHRPDAFWSFDKGIVLNCPANPETEKEALIRLGLPLTDEEKAILASEGGGW